MNKAQYTVVGVMSGTSLDGVDLAECRFTQSSNGNWEYSLGACLTKPYPEFWRKRLADAINLPGFELEELDREYTRYLAGVIRGFIDEHELTGLNAVCSHGHTVHHRPKDGITRQIGNLPEIASLVGLTVVCDFRRQDVALGGEGAPLVPVGDHYLFGAYDYCLNLGGFANCSFTENGQRKAFDICPVNIVLNHYAAKLGYPFDRGGKLARSGCVDAELKDRLDQMKYYHWPPPKSLGLEWVRDVFFPLVNSFGLDHRDILATVTAHAAEQLARQFNTGSSVLVSGGGAYNTFLLQLLKKHKDIQLIIPENKIVDFKEALVFGLLGVLRLTGQNNCLSSVTGAQQDHSSGSVFVPGE